MAFEVTVTIEAGAEDLPSCRLIADELVKIDKGRLATWQPETDHGPAKLRFLFSTKQERDEFIAAAERVPRVQVSLPTGPG